MDVYMSYKFAGLLSSTSAINVAKLCTSAGINQHSGEFKNVHQGAARLCFAVHYSLGGDTAMVGGL